MALTTVPASLSATALTLTTAAQPNITSVGTLTGLTVSGNTVFSGFLDFPDNKGLRLGANDDLQLYHDGSNSYIYDAGDGYLVIMSNGPGIRLNKNNAEVMLDATPDGAVTLYYDNAAKLATTTAGVSVTGTNTATTFTDGYVTWNLAQFNRYGAAIELQFTPTNSATLVKIGANGSNPTIFNAYTGAASFSGNITATATITSGAHLINASSSAFGGSSVQGFNTDFLVDTGQGYARHNSYHTGGSNHQFLVNNTSSTSNDIAMAIAKDKTVTIYGNLKTSDIIASGSGGLSLQTDEGTKRIFISDNGDVKVGQLAVASATTAPLHVAKAGADVQAVFGDNYYTIDDPQIRVIGRNSANSAIRYLFTGLDADANHGFIGYNAGSGGFVNALNFDTSGKVGMGDTAPFSTFQVGSNTFSGNNGMYADSRVGISNHGSLTGLMLASTYNDSNYPEYGLVFVQGPSTSSYNCWSISPDGPAKGNRLNFHYQAQSSNIHTAPRMASLDGSGNFYPVGDVVMAQGKGINFINAADTATGETVSSSILDDYEEGTFNGLMIPETGSITTGSSDNLCTYTRIGRLVTVQGRIQCSAASNPGGQLYVGNLPFTLYNAGENAFSSAVAVNLYNLASNMGGETVGEMTTTGGARILIRGNGGTTSSVHTAGNKIQANSIIGFTATYPTT